MTPAKRNVLREAWEALRANPLEFILLFFAIGAIASTIVATTAVAVIKDPRDDLTFAGAVRELSRTLKDRGPEQVGAIRQATFVVGRDTIVVDTLAVTADSTQEPSLARGGFLRDQIYRFNDNVIRAAIRDAGQRGQPGRRRVETGSVFRLVWTDSGTARLSDTADALGLVIRSPYAEGGWRAVRTIDWRSTPALLGYDGQLALGALPDSGRSRGILNGRDCEMREERQSRHLIYCTSDVGRAVNRFFDVGFTTRNVGANVTFASMFPYRPRDVWVNGKLERFNNRDATAGTLIELRSTGGFLLSAADWGTLAAEQWINGRTTFLNQRAGTLSFFGRAGRSPRSAQSAPFPLTLSFDARLSSDIERQARTFLENHGGVLRRMSVVIMDLKTGEIRAIVEPHRQSDDESLLSFEPLLIGSAVKPIVAAALIARQPALGDMRLEAPDSIVTKVDGVPLVKPFHSAHNGCDGSIGVVDFLRCSNNQFAAELVLRSLVENGYSRRAESNPRVPRSVLEQSDLATGLVQAFDVDPYAGRTTGRFQSYWKDSTANGNLAITRDQTLIPWESRPWLLFPKDDGTPVDLIARYAFGGWENRWTLVGAAQAYARIASDRNVQGTFLHRSTTAVFPHADPTVAAAFSLVRQGLARAADDGTAKGLTPAFQAPGVRPLTVLAKTGTLNEGETNGQTRMKALALVVGEPADSAGGSDAKLKCGLVAMTYFEFQDQWNKRSAARSLPSLHVDFAKDRLAPVVSRQWRRVSGCPIEVPRPAVKTAAAPKRK